MPSTVRSQIRVLIADAQPIFRAGLAREIRQDRDLRLVADVDNGRTALAAIRRLAPAVAILDVLMPGLDGRRLLGAIVRDRLATRAIVLTAEGRQDTAFDAVAAGAGGYLSKLADGETVRRAIKRVAAGESVMCDAAQTLIAEEIRLRHHGDQDLLSRREHEVLGYIAQGLSTPDIARRLGLAPATVRGYVAQVYERLGVGERAHAVAVAMRRGLLD